MIRENYPSVYNRVNAAVIDAIIIVIFIIVTKYILTNIYIVSDNAKTIAFLTIFILYDPILISIIGGTIGHKIIGIEVKRKNNQQKNILFPLAIIRFILKIIIGIISLLTISGNNKGKAIHDLIVGSIVVYKK